MFLYGFPHFVKFLFKLIKLFQISPSTLLRIGYEENKYVSLGILGLNEDFVQLNEVMAILLHFQPQLYLAFHHKFYH